MKINKIGVLLAGMATLAMLAFAPPGVTFSKAGYLYPANPGVASTSNNALVAAGTGIFADALAITTGTAANGLHAFEVHETTGLELHFALSGVLNTTATARVYRAIPVTTGRTSDQPISWTFRHLCDVSLTASAQSRCISGIVVEDNRWANVTVSSDAGLQPLGTRSLNGTTTNAAGSLFIDPICAQFVVVQTKIGTATDVSVFASDWTRN